MLGVEVIEDEIHINADEAMMDFDSALILKAEDGDYMVARTAWFSEVILIAHNESYDTRFSIKKVMETWENDGENRVMVKRSRKRL